MPRTTTTLRFMSRRHWILAALTLVFVASAGWALRDLHREGDAVCRRLDASIDRAPGEGRPCRIDRRATTEDGSTTSTWLTYGGNELREASFDTDGDGHPDETLSCSTVGKILIPVTNTDRWLRVAVDRQLVDQRGFQRIEYRPTEPPAEKVEFDRFRGFIGDHPIGVYRLDRRDEAGRLLERRVKMQENNPPRRTNFYEYDNAGRLVRLRTHGEGSEEPRHISSYRYECSESGGG